MLSLCMIVKNEESSLKKCLDNIVTFVDEIIIVDTGSTDNTKNIGLEYSDKIYDFKWCDDFAKARNFSVSKASNNWILILDADEIIEEFNRDNILEFINNKKNEKIVGRIERINIIEDDDNNKKYIERVNRIFNRKYFHYEGIIHEQIVALNDKAYETENVGITANHVGYTKEVLNRTDKLNRNIKLLEEAVKNDAEDPYLSFQLGKSYYMLREYDTAILYFEKTLSFQLDFRLEYVEDLVETYGYALINSNRYSDALILEDYLEVYSKFADFHFLMGLIYMNNAMLKKAIESFLESTEFPCGKVNGVTSFSAYYNIGVIYDVLGFKEEALKYYKMCGDYQPALKRISERFNYN